VPIPNWVKAALDHWSRAANVTEGKIFRAVARLGKVWGRGISQNVVWYVVRTCCERACLEHNAPHDLRRTCAKLCHDRGGELEQIQFLLGHVSVQTTEHYLGCKQNLGHPVNDLFDLGTDAHKQAKDEEASPTNGPVIAVEKAHEAGIECPHRGPEHEQPLSETNHLSLPERTHLVGPGKDHRPKSLRRCSEAGTSANHAGSKTESGSNQGTSGRLGAGKLLDPAS
jgi:hypothetical protein